MKKFFIFNVLLDLFELKMDGLSSLGRPASYSRPLQCPFSLLYGTAMTSEMDSAGGGRVEGKIRFKNSEQPFGRMRHRGWTQGSSLGR
jgi:hypothetical protein